MTTETHTMTQHQLKFFTRLLAVKHRLHVLASDQHMTLEEVRDHLAAIYTRLNEIIKEKETEEPKND